MVMQGSCKPQNLVRFREGAPTIEKGNDMEYLQTGTSIIVVFIFGIMLIAGILYFVSYVTYTRFTWEEEFVQFCLSYDGTEEHLREFNYAAIRASIEHTQLLGEDVRLWPSAQSAAFNYMVDRITKRKRDDSVRLP